MLLVLALVKLKEAQFSEVKGWFLIEIGVRFLLVAAL